MPRRYYSSTAARTTLSSGINSSVTSITVASTSGFPASFPYTLIIDQDLVTEEIVTVTAASGTTLTVTRGVDGTSAVSHSASAPVNHGVSARDFDEPNDHVNDSTNDVHTQYVRKSLVQNTGLQFADGSASAPSVSNVGDTDTGLFFPADNAVGVTTAGAERVRVDASGNVGIGTSTPAGLLHVDGGVGFLQRYANSGAAILRRANGTAGSPSAVSNADTVAVIVARAFDGSGTYRDVGQISFLASENTTPTASGGVFTVNTTSTGSTTGIERLRIDSTGRIQIPAGGILEAPLTQNARTDSYTLVLADAGKLIEMGKATAQTLTIPLNSSVAFPTGTKIDVIQTGAGETTIAGTGGVTVNSEGSKLKINAQWQAVTLIKRATDTWVLIGAIKA